MSTCAKQPLPGNGSTHPLAPLLRLLWGSPAVLRGMNDRPALAGAPWWPHSVSFCLFVLNPRACIYGFTRLMVMLGQAADGDFLLTDCLLFGAIISATDPGRWPYTGTPKVTFITSGFIQIYKVYIYKLTLWCYSSWRHIHDISTLLIHMYMYSHNCLYLQTIADW